MNRSTRVLALGLSALGMLVACQPKPAKVDLAAEEAAIRQLTKDWFAADAVIQGEGAPVITGPAALRAMYEAQFKVPITDVKMEPRTVVVASSGDLAYDVGAFTLTVSSQPKPVEVAAKSTIIWRKRDGRWKAVVMSGTTDAPGALPAKP